VKDRANVFKRIRVTKKPVFLALIVAVVVAASFGFAAYTKEKNTDKVSFALFTNTGGSKKVASAFTKQDAVMVDVDFKNPIDKNYQINIKRVGSKNEFHIEVPSESGKVRTVSIPKALTASGDIIIELAASTTKDVLQSQRVTISN
jgi:hypothetical protein